jgi:hypothetical protein
MDFVEIMELNDERIYPAPSHYWGWFGVRVIHHDQYHAWQNAMT